MRAVIVVSLLLLAGSCHGGGFLSAIGNFFEGMGHAAVDALKETGTDMIQNATSELGSVAKEGGQMLLFEMGNQKNGKRGVGQLLSHMQEVQKEFNLGLAQSLSSAIHNFEQVVEADKQLIEKMVSGEVNAQAVLDKIPELENAIHNIPGEFTNEMFSKVVNMVNRYSHKRDLDIAHILDDLRPQFEAFVRPFTQQLEQELMTVTNFVESVAQNVLHH